jgi:hypothetical protein
MSNNTVLNPGLFLRLQQLFGEVGVSNPGQPYVAEAYTDLRTGLRRERRSQSGEEYTVRCPYCDDRRRHLSFGHRWIDKPFLANCYHGCLTGPDGRVRRAELRRRILGGTFLPASSVASADKPVPEAQAPAGIDGPQPEVRFPGTAIPLNHLPPDHHARLYLHGRRFDPEELAARYGVAFCSTSENYMAVGRIILPVAMDGKVVGWQGRWPDDEKNSDRPKYYWPPVTPKRKFLYGFDTARLYRTVVLVEGVTDAWRVGTNAVAIFGKSLSNQQRQLLVEHWGSGAIVILLDADAAADAAAIANELEPLMPGRILPVLLPAGLDPGGMDHEAIWRLIGQTAAGRGLTLDLRPQPA